MEGETPPEPVSKDFRTGIAIAVLVGCGIGIGWLLAQGTGENELHKSALTGFFWTWWLVLVGIQVAAMLPAAIDKWKA